MSNYVGEASTYSGKVSSFQATVSQVNSNLTSAANKLNGTADSALKSNVISSINSIKSQLESIVGEAQANASKLMTKARELDAENNKPSASIAIDRNVSTQTGNSTEENGETTKKGLDIKLNGEGNNTQKAEKAIDNHLGSTSPNTTGTTLPKQTAKGLPKYV